MDREPGTAAELPSVPRLRGQRLHDSDVTLKASLEEAGGGLPIRAGKHWVTVQRATARKLTLPEQCCFPH